MTTRYAICKQTLQTNIEYAKLKNIPIVIALFNHSVRVFTNIIICDETKELIKSNFEFKCTLNDNLSYDQIMHEINSSEPQGSTDFLIPFMILDCIKELNKDSEIFFLSDGYNGTQITEESLALLTSYKSRITTMGIGSKHNYDGTLMSKMSKTNDTVEGISADIIQQELLAQMSDMESNPDIWNDVQITILGKKDDIKIGSMMKLTSISEEEYNCTHFVQNTDNENLVMSVGSRNNRMISKKDVMLDVEIETNMLIFIVDQSGSMSDDVKSNSEYEYSSLPGSPKPLNFHRQSFTDSQETLPVPESKQEENIINSEENTSEYVKYSMAMPRMKSYQRIIFSADSKQFKGQIKWTDSENNTKTMILHDSSKYTPITDPIIDHAIEIANQIGNYINIATIGSKDDNIGYFRTINQIYRKEYKFFNDIIKKNLSDFFLMELLFYNKKHGLNLFYSTLTRSEKNIEQLLGNVSAGGGYKLLAATATLSAVSSQTPSLGGGEQDYHESVNIDLSLCSICFDNVREYIFSCGHCHACKTCAEKLLDSDPKNKCAYCRKDITWIRKINMTDDQKNPDHYYKCISDACYNIATIVSKCDDEYHLTYCQKCFSSVKRDYKKAKKTHNCFCGKEMKSIVDKIYFN